MAFAFDPAKYAAAKGRSHPGTSSGIGGFIGTRGKTIAYEVIGDDELKAELATFEGKVQKKLLTKAMRQASKLVKTYAEMNAPVQYGDLAASIKVRAMKRSRKGFGVQVTVGDGFFRGDTWYGAALEFGTKQRRHKSGKSVGRIDEREFAYLRPGLYDNEPEIRQLFLASLRELVKNPKAKLPRIK